MTGVNNDLNDTVVVEWIRRRDPTRLVDEDSGGVANGAGNTR